MIDFFLFRKPISPYFIFAVKPNSVASATCETFGIGLGFRLLNLPCSGNYPFSIKRCATTQNPTALNLEVQRLQKAIEFTNRTVCEESYRRMCSRVTSKLNGFQPMILVDSNSPNSTRSKAHGVYVAQEVIALCCNPLSECADDDGCSSHTPYNVQECCEHCQSTYETCYNHMNTDSGGPLSLTYSSLPMMHQCCSALNMYF
jgi:hypothetical protein